MITDTTEDNGSQGDRENGTNMRDVHIDRGGKEVGKFMSYWKPCINQTFVLEETYFTCRFT